MNRQQSIENVARAFYEAQGRRQTWDSMSDGSKEEFRQYAREAIDLLRADRGQPRLERGLSGKSSTAFSIGLAAPSM